MFAEINFLRHDKIREIFAAKNSTENESSHRCNSLLEFVSEIRKCWMSGEERTDNCNEQRNTQSMVRVFNI